MSHKEGEFEPSRESSTRLSDAAKMTPTQRPAIAPTKSLRRVAVQKKARKQRG
jgi:hypothetical protein